MMVAAACQAVEALAAGRRGLIELDPLLCDTLDRDFRRELGDDAHYLIPPADEAW